MLEYLLGDWIATKMNLLTRTSTDWNGDLEKFIAHAKHVASELGIVWSDDLVPDYVWDILSRT